MTATNNKKQQKRERKKNEYKKEYIAVLKFTCLCCTKNVGGIHEFKIFKMADYSKNLFSIVIIFKKAYLVYNNNSIFILFMVSTC